MRGAASGGSVEAPRDNVVQKPADLDAEQAARWDQYSAELEAALANDESARALHAHAMLDRLRYGSH